MNSKNQFRLRVANPSCVTKSIYSASSTFGSDGRCSCDVCAMLSSIATRSLRVLTTKKEYAMHSTTAHFEVKISLFAWTITPSISKSLSSWQVKMRCTSCNGVRCARCQKQLCDPNGFKIAMRSPNHAVLLDRQSAP